MIIKQPDEYIIEVLGYQEICTDKNYIWSPFVIEVFQNQEAIFYNTLTREVISCEAEINKDFMIQHWFFVPEHWDANTWFENFYHFYSLRYPRPRFNRFTGCTILTTTNCNARCGYCYELDARRETMNEETAKDVGHYIAARIDSNSDFALNWFGGEPLLNPAAIDTICKIIDDSGIPNWHSTMITNGSLLDKFSKDTLVNKWRMRSIQITIDGTREKYEQIKMLSKGSFDKILDTIARLLSYRIYVMIRLHITGDNLNDLKDLVDLLYERFEDDELLYVYVYNIFEDNGDLHGTYDQRIEMDKYIRDTFHYTKNINGQARYYCMVDSGTSTVIDPMGRLSLCEHFFGPEYSYGTIYEPRNLDAEKIAYWQEKMPMSPNCKNCPALPQCIRLKHCPTDSNHCSNERQRWELYVLECQAKDAYDKFLKEQK